ncbi:MAG TPA: tRNA lysidine(34) synthetase TilS, partial [Clostridiales bacterium]|nr:tRNA lysidine(34) synthetase TilS [Clostridiales bacterium]
EGDRVLAAVSGGPDSLTLLHVLSRLRDELPFDLRVAYVDHGLRGDRGAVEMAFVAETAAELGLEFHGETVDAAAAAGRGGLSLEEAARQVRYEALAAVARSWGPGPAGEPRVAVGHNLDDQAETVLMRVIEGTGLDGLAGMPALRRDEGWVLVRPLLTVTREEILDYCRAWSLEPRSDETNTDERFRRNFVRARVLPLLESYNPRVREALVRLAAIAREEAEALEEEAARREARLCRPGVPEGESPFAGLSPVPGSVVAMSRAGLKRLPGALRKRVLRRVLRRLAGPEAGRDIGRAGVERAVRAAERFRVGGRLEFPGGVVLEAGYRYVFLARCEGRRERGRVGDGRDGRHGPGASDGPADSGRPEPAVLAVPGRTEVPALGWSFTAEFIPAGDGTRRRAPRGPGRMEVDLDPDEVEMPLRVRTRRRGDAFRPLGVGGTKKLKDFFISCKTPRAERDRWPLLVDASDRIVWVVGLRPDERFLARRGAGGVLRVTAERLKTRPGGRACR